MRFSRAGSLYAIFFISGATSLGYEVTWTRLLVRVFGTTSLAVATVLASYMAGLAIGSYIFGRWIDRKWLPVRVYGWLELGIGIFALLFPLVIGGLNGLYRAIYPAFGDRYLALTAVRAALSFLVLLVPTILMGGTLPVLSKSVAGQRGGLAARIGALYAVNTFGAVAGAFGAGYVLLPRLGISHTIWFCVALNFAIFASAMALARGRGESQPVSPRASDEAPGIASDVVGAGRPDAPSVLEGRLVLVAFMLTGFAALSVEVLWTRVLALVIGTTVYAFSTMLGSFLLGLALGSAAFSPLAQRARRPGLLFGGVVAAIGGTVFLTSVVFGKLPLIYMGIAHDAGWVWSRIMWIQFLICVITMLIPTFLMGGTFPLVTRLYVRDRAAVGRRVGTAYAFNTVGSILGSFAGSFIFLGLLGIERSFQAILAIYLVAATLLFAGVAEPRRMWRGVAFALIVVAGVLGLAIAPRWDPLLMTSGVYRYAQTYRTVAQLKDVLRDRVLLFYRDGPGATVDVARNANEISLGIDGKGDASTCIIDMTTQTMLADLPLLFHPEPDTVLVIGLGCGVSLGSVERFPVKLIECVEILKSVVRAVEFFNDYNYKCLADPRLKLVIGDARNHLMLTRKKYDVIISEPSNPYISGIGDLFTREFFEMAKSRLKPGGIMCVWFHTYSMGDSDMRAMAKTLVTVFPHNTMWMPNESDLIFLSSMDPLAFDDRLLARFEVPAVRSDLGRIRINEISDVLASYVWGDKGLARYGEGEGRLHTDDNMMLEFSAGRKMFAPRDTACLSTFISTMESPPLMTLPRQVSESVGVRMDARRQSLRGTLDLLEGRTVDGIAFHDRALGLAPADSYVLRAYLEAYMELGYLFASKGDYGRGLESYLKATLDPTYQHTHVAYDGAAFCASKLGDYAKARQYYELSLEGDPLNHASAHNLAAIYMREKNPSAAAAVLENLLAALPGDPDAADGLARVYESRGDHPAKALELAKLATSSHEKKASYYNTLGWIYYDGGSLDEARRALKKALKLAPDDAEALYRLGLVEVAAANNDAAKEYLDRLVSLRRQDAYTAQATKLLRELRAN